MNPLGLLAGLSHLNKALGALLAGLPLGAGTAAASGGDRVGFLAGLLAAVASAVAVYCFPANTAVLADTAGPQDTDTP